MKKLFLAATLLLATISIVSAQSRPTFRVDANFVGSNMPEVFAGVSKTYSILGGLRVGGAAEFAIGQSGFYIAPGLAYSMKGAKTQYSTTRTHYLQVPINGGFRASFTEDMTVSLEVGPYFAYGLAGRTTYKSSNPNTDVFGNKGWINRFDMGLGISAALGYQRYYLQVGYDHGILNLDQYGSSDNSTRNYDFYVGVGVRF